MPLSCTPPPKLAGPTKVRSGKTGEEVQDHSGPAPEAVPIEFAGWLPIFGFSGNCGSHPQFTHTSHPPAGYRFTRSLPSPKKHPPSLWSRRLGRLRHAWSRSMQKLGRLLRPFLGIVRGGPRVSLRARLRVLAAIVRLFVQLRRNGARLGPTLRFLQSRHFQSQLLLAHYRGLVFLPSMPYTYNQNPWVVEIEDPTTLFYPLIENGATRALCIADSPYFPVVKTLLESDQCKAIITHMRSTAKLVPLLFQSDTIRQKVYYTPLGVKVPQRRQTHEESEHLDLLFTNSWCQIPENFFVRGGLDVLVAFAILHKRYPHLRLTLRTHLPKLDDRFHRLIQAGWVRIINRFMAPEEMDALLGSSHIFLLPAARVHIVSLLQAMSYGLAVVASDGWGIEEYLVHERNGLVVKGRYGKTSWEDEEAGMLRENYDSMFQPDPRIVRGLVEAVSRLVEDRELRQRLGKTARRDVQTNYNLDNWNQGLKKVLDQALARSPQRQ
ncbi:MAG: glycosyltransferase family 4 protein [Planctomycetes bacterium]|nr:glycosyltransferase family 4 protein [Planctomycetota bacterium]